MIFQRTGAAPINAETVPGFLSNNWISSASDGCDRWHEIRVEKLVAGGFIVGITFMTLGREEPHHSAVKCDTAADVSKFCLSYNPTEYIVGYPDAEQFKEKQRRLFLDVTRRYQNTISRLLSTHEEFMEKV